MKETVQPLRWHFLHGFMRPLLEHSHTMSYSYTDPGSPSLSRKLRMAGMDTYNFTGEKYAY